MNFNPIQKTDLQEKYTNIPVITVLRKATEKGNGIMRVNAKAIELLNINSVNLNVEAALGKSDETDDLIIALRATSNEKFEIINMETGMTNTIATAAVKKNKSETLTSFISNKIHTMICEHFVTSAVKDDTNTAEFYLELAATENGWCVLTMKD